MYMDAQLDPHRRLFVVRLWLESGSSVDQSDSLIPDALRNQWRGLVENVTTGQRLYFTSLADMSDFISFQLEKK